MRYYLVISTETGDLSESPCRIGVTDDPNHLQYAFDMMASENGPSFCHFEDKPDPAAAFTFNAESLNWLEGKTAVSILVEQSADEMAQRLDADDRFSRVERLESMFDDSAKMSREQIEETLEFIRQM
jgi:hypothetical protein